MTANVRHSTENNEFATPLWLVDKGRYILEEIDLDPASSRWVNRDVRATNYYELDLTRFEETNGLLQPKWEGRTLLNPPGGLVDGSGRAVYRKTKLRHGCDVTGACGLPPGHSHQDVTSSQVVWWRALCKQWWLGNVTAGFFVGFSLELLQSCQSGEGGPHPLNFPFCVPRERIKFDIITSGGARVAGNQPTHSNVLVLLPPDYKTARGDALLRFAEAMKDVGHVGGIK
jgi:hypothetical protein